MVAVSALYNSLPLIDCADQKFVNRDQIFSKLVPLLAAYGNKFGVCLVHRHCTLEEGEMMVATENVCQPERNVQCYPDRWLATGEPYEFTRKPTSSPEGLLEEFRKIVRGVDVLGLFYRHNEDDLPVSEVALERTEERKNIMEIVPRDRTGVTIETSWIPGPHDGNSMLATCECTKKEHVVPSPGPPPPSECVC